MFRHKWILGILLICGVATAQVYYEEIRVQDITIDVYGISSEAGTNIQLNPGAGGGVGITGISNNRVLINGASGLVEGSTVTSTELGHLSGVTSNIQTQLNAFSITESSTSTFTNKSIDADNNTITDIDNNEIKAAAGIELSKLEAMTATSVAITNGSGFLTTSPVTPTELGLLDGLASPLLTEASTVDLVQLEALTANLAVITNGSGVLATGAVSATELGYSDGVTSSLCGINQSCTLTNKTLTTPIIDVTTLEGQTATPTSPSAGDVKFYAKDDEKLYFLNSSGLEQEVGSGSGSGSGINYFDDYQADTIANLVEFDDTAVGGDLDGGSAANLSEALETTAPISQTNSYRITKGAGFDASFEGVKIEIPQADLDELALSGRPLIVSFNYITSANYNAGTEAVSMYYYRVGTDSAAQACNGRDLGGNVTSELGVATTTQSFSCAITLASTTTDVRIAWLVTGTGTATWTMDIDNIKFGPETVVPGSIVTDWVQSDSLVTLSNAPGTYVTYYRRNGDSMDIRGTLTLSGAVTSSVSLTINGYTVGLVPGSGPAGSISLRKTSASSETYFGSIRYSSGSTFSVLAVRDTVNAGTSYMSDNAAVSATVPFTWASGDFMRFELRSIPITEWANGSAQLSTTQVDFSTLKLKYEVSASTANSTVADNAFEVIDLDTKIYNTHPSTVTTGANWRFVAPFTGEYEVIAKLGWDNTTNMARTISAIYINGAVNERLQDLSTVIGFTGAATFSLTEGDTLDFRGYQDDTTSAARGINTGAATNSYISITGIPDFSTFSVFGAYEVLYSEGTATNNVTTNTYVLPTGNSITLTPGTWAIKGRMALRTATSGLSQVLTFFALDNDSSPTELIFSESYSGSGNILETTDQVIFERVDTDVWGIHTVTANTTIYLVARPTFSGAASGTLKPFIEAVRLK